jgi:triacylglycerol esterase/lipase EstA (alpha/beta hydrolase family)
MAARTVEVVARSMGGLVTRYFLSTAGYAGSPVLLSNPVHKLITIGTPHQGTLIARPSWIT